MRRPNEALRQYDLLIRREVRRLAWRCAQSYLEVDDLYTLGQAAALDAVASFEPARGAEGAWVRQRVRWKLQNALRSTSQREMPTEHTARTPNGRNPEEVLTALEDVMWVRTALGVLPPRQRVIIAARISGEVFRETAESLGISRTRVKQEYKAALQRLHDEAVADDRLDE